MKPHLYNIAITGAGVMGLCVAHALRERGHSITLFDPAGFPARNASAMAGGMLAPYGEIEHMPPAFVQASLDSITLWKNMGADVMQNGSLFIAHDEDRYILERFAAHLPNGIGKKLNAQDLEKTESGLGKKFTGGLFIAEEAHLDPQKTLQHLIQTLQAQGVTFQNTEAQGVFDHTIDCRGFAAAQDDTDLRGVKGETILVRNPEFSLSRPVRLMHPRYPLYIVPREDNVFMIGATVIEGAGGDHVSVRSALELLSAAYSLHPSFAESEIIEIRAGIRPAYADNLPRIKINGSNISCNGLFRHGFLLAPIMATCVAGHVDGKQHHSMSLFNGGSDERHDQRREENIRGAA